MHATHTPAVVVCGADGGVELSVAAVLGHLVIQLGEEHAQGGGVCTVEHHAVVAGGRKGRLGHLCRYR